MRKYYFKTEIWLSFLLDTDFDNRPRLFPSRSLKSTNRWCTNARKKTSDKITNKFIMVSL